MNAVELDRATIGIGHRRVLSGVDFAIGAGDFIAGPAIVSQLDATTLVLPDWSGTVHPSGAILLTAG